jgi:hypothetical protein
MGIPRERPVGGRAEDLPELVRDGVGDLADKLGPDDSPASASEDRLVLASEDGPALASALALVLPLPLEDARFGGMFASMNTAEQRKR